MFQSGLAILSGGMPSELLKNVHTFRLNFIRNKGYTYHLRTEYIFTLVNRCRRVEKALEKCWEETCRKIQHMTDEVDFIDDDK